jgi:ribosomal-protein-alanine N-acetyltransferase
MNFLSPGARIRRMTPADIDRVMEIAENVKEAPQWPRSAYLAALASQVGPPRIALVAEAPGNSTEPPSDSSSPPEWGAVAGFAVASLLPPEAELESIAVAPAFQRRGLARRLFDALAEELRPAGITEVILELRASNRTALDFYRVLGFVQTGRRPRYYHDPIEDALLMRLQF